MITRASCIALNFRTYRKDCHSLENNIWKKTISMFEERALAAMAYLPKGSDENAGLFVTGGFGMGGREEGPESKFSELLTPNASSWVVCVWGLSTLTSYKI